MEIKGKLLSASKKPSKLWSADRTLEQKLQEEKNIKTQEKYQLKKTGFSPNIKAEVARKIKIMGKRHSDPINNISHFLGRDGNQPI